MGADCCAHIPNADGKTHLESALRKALGRAGSDEKEKNNCLQRTAGFATCLSLHWGTATVPARQPCADALCSYCWLPEAIN